jgi:hypothetical protein
MNLIAEKRKVLLTSVKDSLEAVPEDDRAIYFYDSEGTLLCTIFFYTLSTSATVGDKVECLFKSADSSTTIRGTVETAGIVKTFRIMGLTDLGEPESIDGDFITGTVGSLSSSADMKFNKTSWSEGMNITISNLYLVMR